MSRKISIITATYNSAKTIRDTIDSVLDQDYKDIEYIIIDGGSTDDIREIVRSYGSRIHVFISEPDKGIYDALNKGIAVSTGSIIGFLHSDDHFAHRRVLSGIINAFNENEEVDATYGDLVFFDRTKENKVTRKVSSGFFRPMHFRFGMMPAHPTFYAKREVYEKFGGFDLQYKIASDFDFLLRVMLKGNIRTKYLSGVIVKMGAGGTSTKNVKSNLLLNKEALKSCRRNGVYSNYFLIYSKYFYKIFQFLYKKEKEPGSRP